MSSRLLSTDSKSSTDSANGCLFGGVQRTAFANAKNTFSQLTDRLERPKFYIGTRNDQYEQEADRVADQVMRSRAPNPATSFPRPIEHAGSAINNPIQRQCACCRNEVEEDGVMQAKATPGRIPTATTEAADGLLSLQGKGQPLPESSRRYFESRFNYDFSRVRIHTGVYADNLAGRANARAFTLGRDVVFGHGQYRPQVRDGQRLIAHELTHVVQQSGTARDVQATSADRNAITVQHRTGPALQGDWSWSGAGWGALGGGLVGAGIGAFFGPIGALIGLGAGALVGGLIGGLAGGREALTEVQRRCARLITRIRRHPVYRALAAAARALADEIMALARQRPNCIYYAEKLHLLLDTPEAPQATEGGPTPEGSNLERNRQRVQQAVEEERARLAMPQAQREQSRQEQIAGAPERRWTERRGRNNKIFYVDSSDPGNVVVQIKIRLLRGGTVTTQEDVNNLIFLEDAIERVAETRGYTMNVIFTDIDGPDVFTFNINFDAWPTAGNPVGNARTLAHEIHHLMGLPDRYDYIESHAANRRMPIPERLHWFREQMNRQPDPQGRTSLMGSGRTMLDDDVCRIADLDMGSCMAARGRALQE
jgi:uncharacterized protein YcfJ